MIKKCTRSLYSGNFWVLSLLPFILYVRHWYHSNPPHTSQMGITWIANYSTTAAAAAKLLQSCPTLCNPIDGSPPASPSLGFSRQEHWSGLPLPFPMHESEKWKWSRSIVSDPQRPHGLQPTRLLRPWDFPGRSSGVGVPLPSQSYCINTANKALHLSLWANDNRIWLMAVHLVLLIVTQLPIHSPKCPQEASLIFYLLQY